MATANHTSDQWVMGYDVPHNNNTLLPNTHVQTDVQVYTVTLSTLLLATVCLCGFLINISLLVSVLWKRRILCCLQYALPINLLVSNLLFCLFWAPVEIVRILLRYNDGSYSRVLLFYTWCLFVHCVVLLFVTVVFIVIYQICYQIGDNKHCLDCIAISGIITSWLGGILVAVCHGLSIAGQEHTATQPSMFTELIVVILVVIVAVMILLAGVILWRKKQLHALEVESQQLQAAVDGGPHRESSVASVSESRSVTKTDHDDRESKSSQLCLNIGKGKTAASDAQPPAKGISFAKGSKQKVSQDNVSDISEDEDSFDTKMRLQFRALASRRHTIGNVGENPFGQTSLFGQRPGVAKANNYQYVRKWSVDVTALQDQLENPKRHGGSLPFQELAILPEREPLMPEKSALKKKSPQEASIAEEKSNDKSSDKEDTTHTETSDKKPTEENQNKPNSTPKTTTFCDPVIEKDDRITKHDSIEITPTATTTTVPTIVVNGNNTENLKTSCEQTDQEINRQNNKTLLRFVHKTKCLFGLVVVYTLCLLPLFVYFLLLHRSGSLFTADQNVVIFVTSLAPLQVIIQPFVLYRMEKKIQQTFRKLRIRVTHWRFVCYCNTCTLHRQRGASVTEDPDEDKSMTKV